MQTLESRRRNTSDSDSQEQYSSAHAVRAQHLAALDEIGAARERSCAALDHVVGVLERLPSHMMMIRALEAEASDRAGGDGLGSVAWFEDELMRIEEEWRDVVDGSRVVSLIDSEPELEIESARSDSGARQPEAAAILRLVDDLDGQRLRARQLGARVHAGDHEVGAARDAAGDARAGRLAPPRSPARASSIEAAGEHDGLALQRAGRAAGRRPDRPCARRRGASVREVAVGRRRRTRRAPSRPSPGRCLRSAADPRRWRRRARRATGNARASNCATCVPTRRMLSPTSSRQIGRSFDASIAPSKFAIDFSLNPGSSASRSAVSA